MFSLTDRRRKRRHKEIVAQVLAIEHYLFNQLHPTFQKTHGHILGAQLARSVVDRVFARPVVVNGTERSLVDSFSATILRDNRCVRDAAFVSLQAMLEVEGDKHNVIAKRRIVDTTVWIKQFGEPPQDRSLAQVFEDLMVVGIEGLQDDASPEHIQPQSEDSASKADVSFQDVDLTGETWQITR